MGRKKLGDALSIKNTGSGRHLYEGAWDSPLRGKFGHAGLAEALRRTKYEFWAETKNLSKADLHAFDQLLSDELKAAPVGAKGLSLQARKRIMQKGEELYEKGTISWPDKKMLRKFVERFHDHVRDVSSSKDSGKTEQQSSTRGTPNATPRNAAPVVETSAPLSDKTPRLRGAAINTVPVAVPTTLGRTDTAGAAPVVKEPQSTTENVKGAEEVDFEEIKEAAEHLPDIGFD